MFSFFNPGPIVSILLFLLNVLVAAAIAYRAWNMGRSFPIWFLYAYLMTLIALIHVFLIAPDENGILYRKNRAICPECARPIDPDSIKCPVCKSDLREKYLYVPSPPSENKVIFLIISAVLAKLFLTFITPDIMNNIVQSVGGSYEETVKNFGITLETFGMPRDIAGIIVEKMSIRP